MTFKPKRQVICETKNGGGFGFYIFHDLTHSHNSSFSVGTHTVEDGIGLIPAGSYGYNNLPLGKYWFHAEAVIEVNSSGKGTWYTFGNMNGFSPSLAWNQLYANADVIRSITEYTVGSKDYVRTSLSFELTKTSIQTNGTLQCIHGGEVSLPYQRIVITKID